MIVKSIIPFILWPAGYGETNRTRLRITLFATVIFLSISIVTAADAAYLQFKAVFAQHLVERAWQHTLDSGGKPHRPWPWADTSPVARLRLASADLDTHVLDGSSGTTLAFGPGRVSGSAEPGNDGVIVIGAHRDTHFKNLHRASVGDSIFLQGRQLQWHEYRVTNIDIADIRTDQINANNTGAKLLLVTCYPFNALVPGGPLRYVIDADLISANVTG